MRVWIKRSIYLFIGLFLFGYLGFQLFKPQIATVIFERVTKQQVGVDFAGQLPDGLHVYLCGTGSPMPDATRAGPCIGVLAGERAYIFDIGSGGTRNLGSMGFPIDRLESVYLTHLHSDHLDGLGELYVFSWVGGGRSEPTPIIGPVGTQKVVEGFNMAYQIDSTYRIAHHGVEVANPSGYGGVAEDIRLPAGPSTGTIVFQDELLTITAIRVEHAPVESAFAYRIDYKDRAISISGDTVYHPGFVAASKGVDLMLHEALDPDMISHLGDRLTERDQPNLAKIMYDILDYHASPEDAARAAQTAGATQLVLYHLVPPLPVSLMEAMFLGEATSEFEGKIIVGKDGLMFSLPAGSDKIIKQSRF